MQYAKIEIPDELELSYQHIGEELEIKLENLGFEVSLPTCADWGYVFRIKTNGHNFDISVVLLSVESFGISIEPEKDVISAIARYIAPPNIKGLKELIAEILTTDIGVKSIKWFTADEWTTSFGKGFWNYC